jgi:type VI secretion system secreted protein Hcp
MGKYDMFLKLDGIDGESRDDVHKGEIDITSWSWGVTNSGPGTGTGGGSGVSRVQDLMVTKYVDNASVPLKKAVLSGRKITNAVLTVRKAGQNPLEYLIIEMQDVYITAQNFSAHSTTDDLPTENVQLNFSKVKTTYKTQKPDGTAGPAVTGGWDVKKNQQM